MTDKTRAADESGVDVKGAQRFPGGDVRYGSAASGAGDNREIPFEEGGDIQKGTGRYVITITIPRLKCLC